MTDDERKTERIQVLMTPSEVSALDDWAFANRIRSRGEAIRRLIEAGLSGQVAPKPDEAAKQPQVQRKGLPPATLGRASSPAAADQDAERGTLKPARPRKATPRAKAAAMSKEAQLRAMREQGSR
jgi:hypothetical protein